MEPIADALKLLADKLGTTTQYLWSVLIRQAPIQSSIYLVQVIILSVVTFFFAKLIKKWAERGDMEDEMGQILFTTIGSILLIVVWTAAFFCLSDCISGFFNPEYWALNKILSTISK